MGLRTERPPRINYAADVEMAVNLRACAGKLTGRMFFINEDAEKSLINALKPLGDLKVAKE